MLNRAPTITAISLFYLSLVGCGDVRTREVEGSSTRSNERVARDTLVNTWTDSLGFGKVTVDASGNLFLATFVNQSVEWRGRKMWDVTTDVSKSRDANVAACGLGIASLVLIPKVLTNGQCFGNSEESTTQETRTVTSDEIGDETYRGQLAPFSGKVYVYANNDYFGSVDSQNGATKLTQSQYQNYRSLGFVILKDNRRSRMKVDVSDVLTGVSQLTSINETAQRNLAGYQNCMNQCQVTHQADSQECHALLSQPHERGQSSDFRDCTRTMSRDENACFESCKEVYPMDVKESIDIAAERLDG